MAHTVVLEALNKMKPPRQAGLPPFREITSTPRGQPLSEATTCLPAAPERGLWFSLQKTRLPHETFMGQQGVSGLGGAFLRPAAA